MGSRGKVLIHEVDLLKNPTHAVAFWGHKTKSPHLTPGGISVTMENSSSNLEDNFLISADATY